MKKIILSFILIFFCYSLIFSQFSITGKITNAKNNNPLHGANIKIVELNTGTISNMHGNYHLKNLDEGTYTLIVSFIGFESYQSTIFINDSIQKNIQLFPLSIELQTTIITATRTNLNKSNVPSKTELISKEQIQYNPITNIDEIFKSIPNMVVNRSWGAFSRNSSVTMRGMDASSRTLVLLNGSPLNKTAGGTIIWDMISLENVKKIEIVKGPGSAIYGNNAMSGIINIITDKPENEKLNGSITVYSGRYNYFGGNFNLGKNFKLGNKTWFWQYHSNYSNGKGYYLKPLQTRDEYDTTAYVEKFNLNLTSGLIMNNNEKLTFEYSYYNGKHGEGIKIYEPEGSYSHFLTNFLSGKYFRNVNDFVLNADFFTQWQNEKRQNENLGNKGYKLNKTFTDTYDYGLFINIGKQWAIHRILLGMDIKNGNLNARSLFWNETNPKDILEYQGNILFYGIYLQDEIRLISNKLFTIMGFRFDHAKFSNAFLNVENPSSFTGFINTELFHFNPNSWSNFSPRIGLLWYLSEKNTLYTSFTSGFMPPKLNDMVSSGIVSKGFKVANPELKPETITNLEMGGRFMLFNNFQVETAIYYSWAKDMVYFIATGDSINTSGNKLSPILQKRNISKVEIYGFEASLIYLLTKKITLNASYTFNHSTINEFYDLNTAQDFKGKYLIEVPKQQYSFSAYWKNKLFNLSVIYNYSGKQWFDDLNTDFIEAYHIVDVKVSSFLTKNMLASLTIKDLFDKQFIDSKGYLSPGRFFLFELKYHLNK